MAEFSSETVTILCAYPVLIEALSKAFHAIREVCDDIRRELAKSEWLRSSEFRPEIRRFPGRLPYLQISRYDWHPRVTPHCPWLHMELICDLEAKLLVGRFDIERDGASVEDVKIAGERLSEIIRTQGINIQGWHEGSQDSQQIVLLERSFSIPEEKLSRKWFVEQGVKLMNELAMILPAVDELMKTLQERMGASENDSHDSDKT